MSENFQSKYARLMLDDEAFDPRVEGMTIKERTALLPAGDEIEAVLTDTLAAMERNKDVLVRGIDPARVQQDIDRLQFWEQLSTLHNAVAQMIRDQELILEDQLQRDANKINKEIKDYIDEDKNVAAEFQKLLTYMSRAVYTRKRNKQRAHTSDDDNNNNNS
jgi:hypothetical protein